MKALIVFLAIFSLYFDLSNGRPNELDEQERQHNRTPSQILMDSVSVKGMYQLNVIARIYST